ncbi:MAG TPA: Fe(3+) ABC transporter substrate-binding protein [Longimicrobiales bacterium]|nr:Fe(3+) ABC transporter substrate-binding protein [Longimicrobiales bacterium]
MKVRRSVAAFMAAAAALAGCGDERAGDGAAAEAGGGSGVVNVYSHRHYDIDQQLFARFTEETGIRVNVVSGSADELITRLQTEGASSPADLLITVDAGRLHRAKERGLLQPVESAELSANIPEGLRDPEGYWYGLTVRARVLVYARDRVDPSQVSTYEALATPAWRGRVLVRSSENVYNQSLMASMVEHAGEDAALEWARGIARNLARSPSGGDTDQVKAVAAGVGDVAISNTYYVAKLASSQDAEEQRVYRQVGVIFPNQQDRGTHINVSGAGVTAHAPNRENAIRLMEFLVSEEAQRLYAEGNQEYPVRPGVPMSEVLASWGEYRGEEINMARLGELNTQAVMLLDRSGWR